MVYTLGEMLLDVMVGQETEIPREAFIKHGHPGGAMLNAAVSLARSRVDTALISEAGDDDVAAFLVGFLQKNGVRTQFIKQYPHSTTSVAIARLDDQKKAHYTFLDNYPDRRSLLSPGHFLSDDILLFGSLYALDPAIRPEIQNILYAAIAAKSILMYDPNIRKPELLTNKKRKKALLENFRLATIIKGSDEDFDAVFGRQSAEKHALSLQKINPEALIFITLGAKGALSVRGNRIFKKETLKVPVVSTIGAGDGFNAGVIAEIVNSRFTKGQLPCKMEKLLEAGIAYSATVCSSAENYIPVKI
ncbi:MAG: fructokinase [bacterium]|nr:MAG: fructokinase [bacterium]